MRVWKWIKSWFEPKHRLDVFKPSKRLVYTYWDGTKDVTADPMRVYKKLLAAWKPLSQSFQEMARGSGEAYEVAIGLLQKVFGLKTPEQGGLGETEVLALFRHFWEYCTSFYEEEPPAPTPAPAPAPSQGAVKVEFPASPEKPQEAPAAKEAQAPEGPSL